MIKFNLNQILSFNQSIHNNKDSILKIFHKIFVNNVNKFRIGNKILIKKENRGKFTSYCNGKVTSNCILIGKNSSNPLIRKRAIFAENAKKWNH